MEAAWPMTGRSAELEQIRLRLENQQPGLVLTGEPGVGKTFLAMECLKLAEHSGYATFRASGTQSAAELPLGAFAPLLPSLDQDSDASSYHNPTVLLRSLTASLLGRAGGRRLFMFVDDAHLLDPASATLVHHLAQVDQVFLLLTVRSRSSTHDAITSLWK